MSEGPAPEASGAAALARAYRLHAKIGRWPELFPRMREAFLEVLVERGVVTSGETLARVLPRMTSEVRAAGLADPALRRLFGEVYAAFRRRRSLLLLDLGKQVPVATVIEKAVEVGADAIGLSALLVSTSKQMPYCVQELARRNLSFPVIIGGAAINRRFGRRIAYTDAGQEYQAGVFYCKDAFEGLSVMDQLSNPVSRAAFQSKILEEARLEKQKSDEWQGLLRDIYDFAAKVRPQEDAPPAK